jgi:preprotein translocase subunit Sec63
VSKFNADDIERARKILNLQDEATVGEIKESYYSLSKKFHPDKVAEEKKESEEQFKEITWAYRTLMDYVSAFRVSFKPADVKKMSVDRITYKHLKQFYDGWWDVI